MSYILHDEGLVDCSTGQTYQYYLKDHLGNVRSVFKANGSTAQLEQEQQYYPFGMEMGGLSYSNSTPNRYKYNGKEYQEEVDWLDYGARMYDASIGRWHCPDPISEYAYELTPYRYAQNNPIRISDPDGLDDFFDINGNFVKSTKYGSNILISHKGKDSNLTSFNYSKSNTSNRKMLSNVTSHYAHKAGVSKDKQISIIDVSKEKVGNAFAAYRPKTGQYLIAVDKESGMINEQAGQKYNMENAYVHEKVHEDKPESRTAFGETMAISTQVNHDSFYDTSSSFQSAIGAYAATNLNGALSSGEIDADQAQKTISELNSSPLGMFMSFSYDEKNKSVQYQLFLQEVIVPAKRK